jgi:TonB family protein
MLLCVVVVRSASGDPIPFPPESQEGGDPNVQPPKLIERTGAIYPQEALQKRLLDEVYVAFVVTESGSVSDVRAFFSRHEVFEAPAILAVSKWKFRPATLKGHPIKTRMVVPIRFIPPKVSGLPAT